MDFSKMCNSEFDSWTDGNTELHGSDRGQLHGHVLLFTSTGRSVVDIIVNSRYEKVYRCYLDC